MATKYVSQTESNGYLVGSDSNNGSTKSLAKLTIESAIAAAADGDTIVINDGTYVAATYFSTTKSLTINPENEYAVTLKRTGAQARVFNISLVGSITLGKLVIDAENNSSTNCIYVANGAGRTTLTLNGTKTQNAGSGAAWLTVVSTNFALYATNTVGRGGAYTGGYNCSSLASGHISINGFDFDNSSTDGASSGTKAAVVIAATSAGVTMHIRNCTGTWKSANSTNSCIRTLGISGVIENNRGLRITGTDTGASIIACANSSIQADGIVIRDNQGINECPGQYLIIVGADGAGANDNKTNYPQMYRNDVSGNSSASLMHGLFFGNIKGGVCFSNRVKKAGIPLLSKLQAESSYFCDNDVDEPMPTGTTGCLRAKGSINTIFSGNRVRLSAGALLQPVTVNQDPTIPTFSSGAIVIGNTFYSPIEMIYAVRVGGSGDSSSASFLLNNWIAPSYASNSFAYGTTYYADAAAWSAAIEPTAYRTVDPTVTDRNFWKLAYEPLKNSALASKAPWLLG